MRRITGTDAYPLQWPPGWRRTPEAGRVEGKHHFRRSGRTNPFWTFSNARDALIAEVRALGGSNFVLSSNFRTDRRDLAIEPSRRPPDQGVAIYFTLNGRPRVMARDKYIRFEENCRSLTLAIEAMRALERHGGGVMMERAFEGFAALAAPDAIVTPAPRSCWDILGINPNATDAQIEAAYKTWAKQLHPDRPGGSHDAMQELNLARERALRREPA